VGTRRGIVVKDKTQGTKLLEERGLAICWPAKIGWIASGLEEVVCVAEKESQSLRGGLVVMNCVRETRDRGGSTKLSCLGGGNAKVKWVWQGVRPGSNVEKAKKK